MRRPERPGVVDLQQRRAAKAKQRNLDRRDSGGPGPWTAWAVLLAIAIAWALIRTLRA